MEHAYIRALIVGGVSALASGCLTPQSDAVTNLVRASAATTVTNASGGDVYLAVDTAWESDSEVFERHGTCQVNTGDAARQKTCTIRVPEGKLFFSDTKFSFGTANPTLCHRMQFFPAIWQESSANGNTIARTGSPGPNCLTSALVDIPGVPGVPSGNSACFFGPARALYTDWPTTLGSYFRTSSGDLNESSQTIPSGNSLASTISLVIDRNWISNLAVVNKVDSVAASITSPAGSDVYVANTMYPYRARCLDKYEQIKAEVLVYVADEDLETGESPGVPANDQFYDFQQTL